MAAIIVAQGDVIDLQDIVPGLMLSVTEIFETLKL
jgi:hypothetical protein